VSRERFPPSALDVASKNFHLAFSSGNGVNDESAATPTTRDDLQLLQDYAGAADIPEKIFGSRMPIAEARRAGLSIDGISHGKVLSISQMQQAPPSSRN
jgi:hypothetical protein